MPWRFLRGRVKSMIKKGTLLFLGTGGSMGTPVIGCSCAVCTSEDQRNMRLRSSVLCTINGQRILVDCGPDFKQQALKYDIDLIDGVIFTHAHNDHTAGIDELRVICLRSGKPIPCLLSEDTAKDLRIRFSYIFEEREPYAGLVARLGMQEFERDRGEVVFQGVRIEYMSYDQLGMRVDGLRFGDLAYISDIKEYPESIFMDLKGVKTLVLSALRFQETKMHFSVDDAIAFAKRVGAEKTWLMHVSHELDHEKANAYLPDNIRLAYDGLELEFEADIVEE
jgi:phosphoribosyl 1,2-cyclic phosphate phosphodiesterase